MNNKSPLQKWQAVSITEADIWHLSLKEIKAKLKELNVLVFNEKGRFKRRGHYWRGVQSGFLCYTTEKPKMQWNISGFVAATDYGVYIGSDDVSLWFRYALCLASIINIKNVNI
jgi:hypothetical protein